MASLERVTHYVRTEYHAKRLVATRRQFRESITYALRHKLGTVVCSLADLEHAHTGYRSKRIISIGDTNQVISACPEKEARQFAEARA